MARGVRVVLAGLVVLYAGLIVWAALVLPDRVPSHWSGTGGPGDFDSRTGTVVMLVVLGVIMPGLFVALAWLIPRSHNLVGLNVPARDYWTREENLPRAREMARADLLVMGCLATLFCCVLPPSLVAASRDPAHHLPWWSMAGFIASVVALVGYTAWTVAVRWRRPASDRSPTGS